MQQPDEPSWTRRRGRPLTNPAGEVAGDALLAVAVALAGPVTDQVEALPLVSDQRLREACLELGVGPGRIYHQADLSDEGVQAALLAAVLGDGPPLRVAVRVKDEVPIPVYACLFAEHLFRLDLDDDVETGGLRGDVDVVVGVCGYPGWTHDVPFVQYACGDSHADPAADWVLPMLSDDSRTWPLVALADAGIRHRRAQRAETSQ